MTNENRQIIKAWQSLARQVTPAALDDLLDDPQFFVWFARQVNCSPNKARQVIIQDLL